jgi:2,3-bisphosphoglycerate-dependent phosphoglycerate mutase
MLAQAIIVKNGYVLMLQEHVQRGDLVWNFPGGQIESGETPEQACVREVKEETGYDVRISHLLHVSGHKYTFIAAIVGGELGIDSDNPANRDIVSAEWVDINRNDIWDKVTLPIYEAYKQQADDLKSVYMVRHCKAEGQEPEAALTAQGWNQVEQLRSLFADIQLQAAVSSPYRRARQTLECLSGRTEVSIEIDERLSERVLSSEQMKDWLECLEQTFVEADLCFIGGESSRSAASRIISILQELLDSDKRTFVLVTHGNLLSLLLRNYEDRFGFAEWKSLSNPDVYRLTFCRGEFIRMDRVWHSALPLL